MPESVPVLTTERLELVPLNPDRDGESLHAMISDSEVFRFDPTAGPTRTLNETRKRLVDEVTGSDGWTWTMRLQGRDEALGTFGLFDGPPGPIRGLTWRLCRDHWGQGIMSEVAPVAVDALLARPDIDGVEAWIDIENVRSLSVARRARLDERSRLPLVYSDRVSQSVVMARAAVGARQDVLAVRPSLAVRDVRQTTSLFITVLGMHPVFSHGDPPAFCRLGIGPWSGSPGVDLIASDGEIQPASIAVDIGESTDVVFHRAIATGLECVSDPEDRPWMRREFEFLLPERHRIRVIGPLNLRRVESGVLE